MRVIRSLFLEAGTGVLVSIRILSLLIQPVQHEEGGYSEHHDSPHQRGRAENRWSLLHICLLGGARCGLLAFDSDLGFVLIAY